MNKLRPDSLALTALLAFLSAFGPLSVDLFLPSMPQIGRAYGAPPSQVQLTISLYLFGFAIGQIIYGPIADRFGRKPIIIAAFAIFCAATAGCLVAPTIETLIAGRVVQALGASGSIVVARAVVRDLYEGVRAGQQLSLMGVMMGLMPIVAPIIGGALLTLFHWRAGFVFQFGVAALAAYLVWRFLPETQAREPASSADLLGGYRLIGTHPVFLTNLMVGAVGYSGLFAWISGSSFVLQNIVGLSPFQYAVCYALSCVGFMIGGILATRFVVRLGLDKTAGLGALLLALAGTAMAVSVSVGTLLPVGLTLAMDLYLCGLGLLLPQLVAAAMTPFPNHAGTASSLIGFVQQCAGAAMGAVIGYTLGPTAWPVAIGTLCAGCGALVLWVATRRTRTAAAR